MSKKYDEKRRDFVKKAVYVAPAILTLQAFSSSAKAGSEKEPVDGQTPLPKKKKKARR